MLPQAWAAIGVLGAEAEDLLNARSKRSDQFERHDQRVGLFRRDDRSLHRDGEPATVEVSGHVGPAAMNDFPAEQHGISCFQQGRDRHFWGSYIVEVIPVLAPGDQARGTVFLGEIGQRQHQVGDGARRMFIHGHERLVLRHVAVQHLRFVAWADLDQLGRGQPPVTALRGVEHVPQVVKEVVIEDLLAKGLAVGDEVGEPFGLAAMELGDLVLVLGAGLERGQGASSSLLIRATCSGVMKLRMITAPAWSLSSAISCAGVERVTTGRLKVSREADIERTPD